MAQIQCKKCNQKFKSIIDMYYHICLNEPTAPKWTGSIGSRIRSPQKYWEKTIVPAWLSVENRRHLKQIKKSREE